jgi:uncharacterized membrane protein YfcA
MTGALVVGFLAGLLAGVLGVGGGILFVPALVVFLDFPQLEAEATSLLAIIPVALVGAWRQHGYGNVRLRDGVIAGLLSGLGALAGVMAANTVPARALEVAFALLALAIAVQLIRRALSGEPEPEREPA